MRSEGGHGGNPGADPRTLAFYEREAEGYARWSEAHPPSDFFRQASGRIRPGGHVLDFGCGGGWAARAFHAADFRVTALDPSPALLAQVAPAGGISTLCGDAAVLPDTPIFDAIWAHFSLQHIRRRDLPDVLKRIARCLKPGGLLFIAIHEGSETLRDTLDRLYCHWRQSALEALLEPLGLITRSAHTRPDRGHDGRPFTALYLESEKHA